MVVQSPKLYRDGALIGEVNKKWLSWGDSYEVQVLDEAVETLLIALVVAISCVKADQAVVAATSTN